MMSVPRRYYHQHLQEQSSHSSLLQRLHHWLSPQRHPQLLLGFITLVVGAVAGLVMTQSPPQLASPLQSQLATQDQFNFLPDEYFQLETPLSGMVAGRDTERKRVYGFLPYWELEDAVMHRELTDLAYFGLTLGADGNFVYTTRDGGGDPGTNRADSERVQSLERLMQLRGDRFHMVVKQFNNDDIAAFLNSERSHQRFIDNLNQILATRDVDGINMDIEYSGKDPVSLQPGYVSLMRELHGFLDDNYPETELSVDVYASAADEGQIWDIDGLEPYVDHIVVMAYDFHRRSSTRSGPVAPIFGAGDKWGSDINSTLAKFLEMVPNEKILLGVPFYGYGWQTTEDTAPSNTFPDSGYTVRYRELRELLQDESRENLRVRWQSDSLTPYLTYREGDAIYTVQFDDSRSLSYKLSLVNELELGGIAIWALGYEGDTRELWDTIERKL